MSGALERFLTAARAAGLEPEIRRFPEGTRTAEDAARAVGCDVRQIVKSLVFLADGRPILALTSGINRVDPAKLAAVLGVTEARRATSDEAREATGYAVGGTPPFGFASSVRTLIDPTLLASDEVWAGAGTPEAVFLIAPADLVRVTHATVAEFAEGA